MGLVETAGITCLSPGLFDAGSGLRRHETAASSGQLDGQSDRRFDDGQLPTSVQLGSADSDMELDSGMRVNLSMGAGLGKVADLAIQTSGTSFTRLDFRRFLNPEQIADLYTIAKQTWQFLWRYLHPDTGLPYDRVRLQQKGVEKIKVTDNVTSPTNIGLALLSLAAAKKMRLVDSGRAQAKAAQILKTLSEMEKYQGLFYNWYEVGSGKKLTAWPNSEKHCYDPFISSVDNGWLAVGLLYLENVFPELKSQVRQLISLMDFSLLYQSDGSFVGCIYPNLETASAHYYDLEYLSETR
ncbi:MAG: DUF3131 domain-containing protein, partial [Candidatus Pacebacteria bacterium]|nr:DUF3131 domain-containing protein [Candidatus Paceibacterota bacterium]